MKLKNFSEINEVSQGNGDGGVYISSFRFILGCNYFIDRRSLPLLAAIEAGFDPVNLWGIDMQCLEVCIQVF